MNTEYNAHYAQQWCTKKGQLSTSSVAYKCSHRYFRANYKHASCKEV